eukprot:scaffold326832_cov245-Tisochrysis_lutea.AAC.1
MGRWACGWARGASWGAGSQVGRAGVVWCGVRGATRRVLCGAGLVVGHGLVARCGTHRGAGD